MALFGPPNIEKLSETNNVKGLIKALGYKKDPDIPVRAAQALAWISAHEPQPRGWYAGPVGWVDDRGNGEFVVALRSGVIAASVAMLYAGAGVVRGSTPKAELAEIELKLSTFRSALGVANQ